MFYVQSRKALTKSYDGLCTFVAFYPSTGDMPQEWDISPNQLDYIPSFRLPIKALIMLRFGEPRLCGCFAGS